MAELRQVTEILTMLAAAYPRFTLQKETIRVYALLLEDIPIAALRAAALEIAATSKWFPTASELRQTAFDLQTGVPTAETAAAEVWQAIQRVGHMYRPEFSHPNVEATVEAIGGWRMLCLSGNPVADRARFLGCYRNIARQHRRDERMLPTVRAMVQGLADRLQVAQIEERTQWGSGGRHG